MDQDEESIHEPFKNGTFTDGEIKVRLNLKYYKTSYSRNIKNSINPVSPVKSLKTVFLKGQTAPQSSTTVQSPSILKKRKRSNGMDLNESKKQRRVSFSDQFFEPANTRNGAPKNSLRIFFTGEIILVRQKK